MNNKTLVKLSNVIGIVSIIALVYWVFTFISIEVFGFKVFRENMTETFYLSILGILALMFGALIINVMFNLTRIAEKHNQDDKIKKSSTKLWFLFILSFPLLFFLLWGGNFLTKNKKEKMLIVSAKSIVENDTTKSNLLVNYSFTTEWATQTEDILKIISKTDKHFPNVYVIVTDTLESANVFLRFSNYNLYYNDVKHKELYAKSYYIASTTKAERDYFNKVFYENNNEIRFSSRNGNYELFYPYRKNGKVIVLYFSDYQRYGKIGS